MFVRYSSLGWEIIGFLLVGNLIIISSDSLSNPPQIQFSSVSPDGEIIDVNSHRRYTISDGKPLSLILKCTAFYPIYWQTKESTLKKFNITSWTNKRESELWKLDNDTNYNFTSWVSVNVDPTLIKYSDKITYSCQSVLGSNCKNSVHLQVKYRQQQSSLLIIVHENSLLLKSTPNCPLDTWTDNSGTKGLQSYPYLPSEKRHKENLHCNDILYIHQKILENDELSGNKTVRVIKCSAHKNYLAMGMRLDYKMNGLYYKGKNLTEITSGEYYEIEMRIPHNQSPLIDKVVCFAPYWNNGDWCKTTADPKKMQNTTAKEDFIKNIEVQNFPDELDNVNLRSNLPEDNTQSTNSNDSFQYFDDKNENLLLSSIIISSSASLTISFFVIFIFGGAVFYFIFRRKRNIRRNKSILPDRQVLLSAENLPHRPILQVNYDCHEILKENLIIGRLYMVFEFCANGSLREYLRRQKVAFKYFKSDNKTVKLEQPRLQANFTSSVKDLILWSLDIAKGMQFLSSQNIVHGDLACRNVLLSENRVAKLSDFGLAKQLEEYYYVNKKEVPMPWKWMAFEFLLHRKCSTKSDVWSYGVTLWEIFSFGDTPWVGCQWGEEFLETLAAGVRPKKPEYASVEIYHIMEQCWRLESIFRPEFSETVRNLEKILATKTIDEMETSALSGDLNHSETNNSTEFDNYLIPKMQIRRQQYIYGNRSTL